MRPDKPQLVRRAEADSSESRARQLEQVLEQTGEAVIVKDLDAVVTFWNREAASLYGFSAAEAVGRPLRKLHAAELSEADYARVLERVRAGKPTSATTERRKKSGEVVRVALKTTPLLDAQGHLVGEITVARDITTLHRTEEALRAAHAALEAKLVEMRRANKALAATVRQLESFHREDEMLSRMAELFQSCAQRSEAYAVVHDTVGQLFGDADGALYIYRDSRDVLERAVNWGPEQAQEPVMAPDDCWALRLGQPHYVDRKGAVRCRHAPQPGRSYVCMPVQGQGHVLGLLHLALEMNARAGRLSAEVDRRLRALADRIGPALANLKLRDALRELALRDTLTGLYNRRYLDETLTRELHRAERSGKPVSVIMIDIDHFKHFNDKFGHDAGDFVLSAVAKAIGKNIRASDLACRYGGEELVVVLIEADMECARGRAETLRRTVKETNVTHLGQSLPAPSASFGVAAYPLHGKTAAEVMKAADQALYRAKQEGRDRVCAAEAPPAG